MPGVPDEAEADDRAVRLGEHGMIAEGDERAPLGGVGKPMAGQGLAEGFPSVQRRGVPGNDRRVISLRACCNIGDDAREAQDVGWDS